MSFQEAFAPLHAPRQTWKVEHHLMKILIISLCGLFSGAKSYTDISDTEQRMSL